MKLSFIGVVNDGLLEDLVLKLSKHKDKFVDIEIKFSKKLRTPKQNNALHLYFENLSNTLNEAGLDMRRTLKEDVDIPWTPENVKNYLWRKIQIALLNKQSTTEITTKEIDKVYDVLNRELAKKGVHEPFPSEEELKRRYLGWH